MKNVVFCNITPWGLVRTDVSDKHVATIIRTLAVTSLKSPPKRLFLQESHGVTSQKTAFFNDLNACFIVIRLSVNTLSS
jgi:hypothetical protein